MSTIESTTPPSAKFAASRRRLIVYGLLFCLVLSFLGWAYILMRLTSASKEGIDHFENRVRHRLVHEGYLPSQYRYWYPENQDLAKHFIFYMPFGILAALTHTIVRLSPKGTCPAAITPRRAAIGLLCLGLGLATIDEIRQVWIPSRTAEVIDVLAGWSGIAVGFIVLLLLERGALLLIPNRFLPAKK